MKKILLLVTILLMSTIWSVRADTYNFSDSGRFADAHIYSSATNNNYGANTTIIQSSGRAILWRLEDNWFDSLGADKDVDSIVCSLRVNSTAGLDSIPVYLVWKSDCWVEGTGTTATPTAAGASWNDWDGPNSEWAVAGCGQGNDAGSYNCTDAGGDDRKVSVEDTLFTENTTGWKTFRITGASAQAMYDAGRAICVLLGTNSQFLTDFHSREATSASNRPRMTVYYQSVTPPSAGGSNVVIRGSVIQGAVIR